jgi:cyclic pyranopterin phosphate synthase
MNNVDFPLADLLKGIAAAQDTGFALIKINIVVKKGVNDQNIGTITRRLQDSSHTTHFIKLMDAGASYGWRMNDVVPSFKTMRIISAQTPLIEAELNSIDEVAKRWAYANGNDEIGIIFSVPQTFFPHIPAPDSPHWASCTPICFHRPAMGYVRSCVHARATSKVPRPAA